MVACVAWRFWLGALNKKGGQGQRNREEIGAGASPLVRARFARVFGALPLSRTPDKLRYATQAWGLNSFLTHVQPLDQV